jgi:hypothetical protein
MMNTTGFPVSLRVLRALRGENKLKKWLTTKDTKFTKVIPCSVLMQRGQSVKRIEPVDGIAVA